MRYLKTASLMFTLALTSSVVRAESWKVLGARPMGMGGAFVALAEGPIAQYWNPAGLAQSQGRFGLQIPASARVEFTGGVLKDANTLGDLATKFSQIQDAQRTGTPGKLDADKISAFYQALASIADMNQPGKGVVADVAGGANLRLGRFAFSVNNFTSIGGSPFVDTTNIGLGPSTGLSGASFSGANTSLCGGASCTGAPSNASNATAATNITNALSPSFASLDNLMGGALSSAGVTSSNIGNVLVNIGTSNNNLTPEQIKSAADTISQNAGAATPLIQAAASGNSYTNNQTNLTLRGGSFMEAALGYGRQVFPGVMVGGNLKMIRGTVGYYSFKVLEKNAGTGTALKDYNSSAATSLRPGLDLGVLWHVGETFHRVPLHPRIGLVARNINDPKFDQPAAATTNGEDSNYTLNHQLRVGTAISPLNFWNIVMDVDLTQNQTPVPGFRSQMFGLGTEINIFNRSWLNIPLRVGIMKNVSTSPSKLGYTAGLGFNLLHFMLDIGGSISSETTQIQTGDNSKNVPTNASLAAQVGFVFGGSENTESRWHMREAEEVPAQEPSTQPSAVGTAKPPKQKPEAQPAKSSSEQKEQPKQEEPLPQ